ncbi:hypothetical protein [Thermanaerothrix daxensis]|nr:hypothetical protein [Thermanaerothrix daxensis]
MALIIPAEPPWVRISLVIPLSGAMTFWTIQPGEKPSNRAKDPARQEPNTIDDVWKVL